MSISLIPGVYNSSDQTFSCDTQETIHHCEKGCWAWVKYLLGQNTYFRANDRGTQRTLYVPFSEIHATSSETKDGSSAFGRIFLNSLPAQPPADNRPIHPPTSSKTMPRENPLSKRLRAWNDPDCKREIVGVCITTNEEGSKEIREILKQTPPVPKSCHIGFSGWYNFDIMAVRRSTYGLICDCNPNNKVFIEKTLEILRNTPSRRSFVNQMARFVSWQDLYGGRHFSPNPNRTALNVEEEVKNELTREGSWLESDETFHYIRGLAMEDRIAAITVDIRDTARFRTITQIYRDNFTAIDSLYLSNICGYMSKEEDKRNFASTVHVLVDPETFVINCPTYPRQFLDNGPRQRICLGKVLSDPARDERLFKIQSDRDLY